MAGLFHEWQPRYAEVGIATFPVRDKRPAVKGFLKMGAQTSQQLALKFANDDSFGFACKRRIVVLDVDTPDERIFADALAEHGDTPVIVRSGSGNWQGWYRSSGEKRMIRPFGPEKPIDILGIGGFVVAPPSRGSKGAYQFIDGSLDDIPHLPPMHRAPAPTGRLIAKADATPVAASDYATMQDGDGRNTTLFRRLVAAAHAALSMEELMQTAVQFNGQFAQPLPDSEVSRSVGQVWKYKQEDRLFRTGGEANAVVTHSEMEHLWDAPVALMLLCRLRMAHSHRNGSEFAIALAMAEGIGVSRPTFRAARDTLVDRYFIEITHPGGRGKNDPPRARLL